MGDAASEAASRHIGFVWPIIPPASPQMALDGYVDREHSRRHRMAAIQAVEASGGQNDASDRRDRSDGAPVLRCTDLGVGGSNAQRKQLRWRVRKHLRQRVSHLLAGDDIHGSERVCPTRRELRRQLTIDQPHGGTSLDGHPVVRVSNASATLGVEALAGKSPVRCSPASASARTRRWRSSSAEASL